jgi:hypothetical protein
MHKSPTDPSQGCRGKPRATVAWNDKLNLIKYPFWGGHMGLRGTRTLFCGSFSARKQGSVRKLQAHYVGCGTPVAGFGAQWLPEVPVKWGWTVKPVSC